MGNKTSSPRSSTKSNGGNTSGRRNSDVYVDEDLDLVENILVPDVTVRTDTKDWYTAVLILGDGIVKFIDSTSNDSIEFRLADFPNVSLEEMEAGVFVLSIANDKHNLKMKSKDKDQVLSWLKFIRFQIMMSVNDADVFTSRMLDLTEHFAQVSTNADPLHAAEADGNSNAAAVRRDNFQKIKAPTMNIVILVVGTRGDVQPFVYLGQQLKKDGHRVRLATHAEYRKDVIGGGLEFYPLAGDPRKLSEYMVKTAGRLIPDLLNKDERKELPEKMQMLKEICFSTHPACTQADPEDANRTPFLADAIISNPVSYGHIHCAQALSIPLHIMFPQPWSPTKSYPHPLSNLGFASNWSNKNYYSYLMVEEFMWLGLGGMINNFRKSILSLPPIRFGEHGESLLNIWKVPISHMWSPAFVPPCQDWLSHVDVVGEFRLTNTAANPYTPDQKLVEFLRAGAKPIYIGFGSMVIDDSSKLVNIIKEAAKQIKCRVLLQSGWTKYAEDYEMISEEVMVIGAMPHDYLFSQVSGVCHHGGAGTTSAGLRAGNPTFICPFFGDQHFWAEMVFRSGVGPKGCPVKELTTAKLVEAFQTMLNPETIQKVRALSERMNQEDGVAQGAASFYRNLPLDSMICDVSIFDKQQSKLATIRCEDCNLKMCREVDEVVHRKNGSRANHVRHPNYSKLWGKSGHASLPTRSSSDALAATAASASPAGPAVAKSEKKFSMSKIHSTISGVFKTSSSSNIAKPAATTAPPPISPRSAGLEQLDNAAFEIEQAFKRAVAFQGFWNKLDVDGNASVDESELAAFFANANDAKTIMSLVDWNGDHSLSFAELAWVISQQPSLVDKAK